MDQASQMIQPVISLLSICLVIIGWRVIYSNAKKISTRSETKSIIDDAITIIKSIQELNINYWLDSENTKSNDHYLFSIEAKMLTLNHRIEILKQRNISVSNDIFSQFYSTCTLDYEKRANLSVSERTVYVNDFLESSIRVTEDLYSQFLTHYNPSPVKSKPRD